MHKAEKKIYFSYTKVSANDEIKWKKAAAKRWEFADKFEYV